MPGIFAKSNVPGIFVAMNDSTRNMRPRGKRSKRHSTGPIAFFVSLFIIALGAIQLVSTFHTYALNLAQLNDLKNQEAALITKKQDLENDIERWNDDSYVATQARERLGFVFPGEKAVRVQHPEAVTGTSEGTAKTKSGTSDGKVLPWYSELEYSFKKADERPSKTASGSQSGDTGKADGNSGSATDTNSGDKQ